MLTIFDIINYNYFFYIHFIRLFLGLEKIEYLQSHDNRVIYYKSFYIIEQYFSSDEEDNRLAPNETDDQFTFNHDMNGTEHFNI